MRFAFVAIATLIGVCASCGRSTCDSFVTLDYTVSGYDAVSCALVMTAGSARAEYDFPAPTVQGCSACLLSTCTTVSGPAPSYCAWTADTMHDSIAIQFEPPSVSALETYLGAQTFTVNVTCGGTPVAINDSSSVQCIAPAAD
jgi:hypothetical protein